MPDPRPVWMLIPTFFPVVGGAQTQALALSKALVQQGRDVRFLTRRSGYYGLDGDDPASDEVDGIPVRRVGGFGGSPAFLVLALWYLLRHGRRAIYHAHDDAGVCAILAVLGKLLLGGRAVIKLRTGVAYYRNQYLRGRRGLQFRLVLRLADVIVVTNSEVERMVRGLGVREDRVHLIPNGIDTRRFAPADQDEMRAARDQLDLARDGVLVIYVGRLAWWKGVDVLLAAWARLPASSREGATLLLIGDGPDRDDLFAQIGDLSLEDSVIDMGRRESVERVYRAADLFVLPSRTEGFSNSLAEAMAAGLPVVATSVGGNADVLRDGVNGLVVPPDDEARLAQAIESLVGDADLRRMLGKAARQTIVEAADLTRTVGALSATYVPLDDS